MLAWKCDQNVPVKVGEVRSADRKAAQRLTKD